MTCCEAIQNMLVVEARAAASAASTAVATGVISEAVTRITRLEERGEAMHPRAIRSAS